MERDRGSLLDIQLVERMRQVQPRFARDLALGAAQPPKALGERLEAMATPVRRDAFIHGDSGEPGSGVFIAQTADTLPGLEKGFLDGILGQRLIPQDQTSGP